jgi:hypothetical protein
VRLVALALSCATGCGQLLAPEVGPPTREVCSNIDSDPDRDVSYAKDIAPVFVEYHCPKCHTHGGATPQGLSVGGLDLESFETLRAGGVQSGAEIVVGGQPCASVLLQKLGAGPPFGSRMPLDGPPYPDAEDLELLSDWIVEGARDN